MSGQMTGKVALHVRKAPTSVLGVALRHSQQCFLHLGPFAEDTVKEEFSA